MKIADYFLMILYGVLGAGIFIMSLGQSDQVSTILIHSGNEVVREIAVPVDQLIAIELENGDNHAVIHVEGAMAWFESSTCSDQLCVHHGPTEHPYDIRVCLPNEFWIELVGDDSEIDAISK